jgi:hypothetical protein
LLLLFAAVGCHAGIITIRTQVRLRPAQARFPEASVSGLVTSAMTLLGGCPSLLFIVSEDVSEFL